MVVGGGWINPLQTLPQGLVFTFDFDFDFDFDPDPDPELDKKNWVLFLFYVYIFFLSDHLKVKIKGGIIGGIQSF